MKFMKEQEHEILKLETGELVIKAYEGAIGEIMFYDGSFRLALKSENWKGMKRVVINLIDDALEKSLVNTSSKEEASK